MSFALRGEALLTRIETVMGKPIHRETERVVTTDEYEIPNEVA
jgi:hypothetical protein